jgi:Domain of unknown function (DUF389)
MVATIMKTEVGDGEPGFKIQVKITVAMDSLKSESGQRATSGPNSGFIWKPDALSWIVGFLAGIAGMLALTSAKSGALVGVLISVTTIPAAANVQRRLLLLVGAALPFSGSPGWAVSPPSRVRVGSTPGSGIGSSVALVSVGSVGTTVGRPLEGVGAAVDDGSVTAQAADTNSNIPAAAHQNLGKARTCT